MSAERRNTQRLSGVLHLGVTHHSVGHRLRQRDVVGDHPSIPGRTGMPEREPHFECATFARVLRAQLNEVRPAFFEVVVGRMVGKRGMQRLDVSDERATRFERRVQPRVRIDGDGIRLIQGPQ